MHPRTHRASFAARLTLTLLVGAATLCTGSSPSKATPSHQPHVRATRTRAQRRVAPKSAAKAAPGVAGMVVAIDPQSHALGQPTREQMAELSALGLPALNQSTEGLVIVNYPDGSASMDLKGRFQQYSIIHIGPRHQKTFQCLDDTAAIRRALDDRQPPPPISEEQ